MTRKYKKPHCSENPQIQMWLKLSKAHKTDDTWQSSAFGQKTNFHYSRVWHGIPLIWSE